MVLASLACPHLSGVLGGGAGGRKEGLCSLPTTSLFPALLLLLNWGREASLFRKSFLDNYLEGGHPLGTPTPRKGA